ncbi:adenosinetriphosphatase [Cladophialophora yegresii CBS 114405]|uniref:DNA helicase n=1 Tax=Cladophialophora yegresii CBS 114405 TaxID=1182544 RepID=W9W9I1_9EURO|nr:adenosinetriphosphatase [Cladophialophora yegresii CBS 114405]EXJ64598.1 adenosinetriphosphatase [Cladophialophora yegresii CBS 114405]
MPTPTGDSLTHSNTADQQRQQDPLHYRSQSPVRVHGTPPNSSVEHHDSHDNANHEPPAKKRKVAGPEHKQSPRPVSPPWRRVVAEGPTSFVVDGRRKSGRTNIIPLDLQPQSNKRQTRAAFDKVKEEHQKHVKPVYNINMSARKSNTEVVVPSRSPSAVKRATAPPTKSRDSATQVHIAKIESLQRQIKELEKARFKTSHTPQPKSSKSPGRPASAGGRRPRLNSLKVNGVHKEQRPIGGTVTLEPGSDSSDLDSSLSEPDVSSRAPTPPLTLRKVVFRVQLPPPTVATPANIPPSKKFASLEEFLEKDDTEPRLAEDTLTQDQIKKEAMVRTKVRQAQKRGGVLDKKLVDTLPKHQAEPKRQYAHHDHLLAHVLHFRRLLEVETKDHRRKAQNLAYEAKRYVEDKQSRNKVKTVAEIVQEQREACIAAYRSVVKDVDKLWAAVRAEVNAMRQKEYEEEQQAKMKGHLARVLDRTDQMLSRAAEQDGLTTDTDTDMSMDEAMDSESENSEQMSDSQTESESETDGQDADAEMSLEELKKKYDNLQDLAIEASDAEEPPGLIEDQPSPDPAQEESDPETEMDSEFDTDESEDDDDDQNSGEEDEGDEDEDEPDLLSMLFSKAQRAKIEKEVDQEVEMGESESRSTHLVEELRDEPRPDGDQEVEDGDSPSRGTRLVEELTDEPKPDGDQYGGQNVPDHGASEKVEAGVTGRLDVKLEVVASQQGEDAIVRDATSPSHLEIPHLHSEDAVSQDPSTHTSPHTTATKVSEPDSVSSIDAQIDPAPPATPSDTKPTIETPVPSLLRGTLREYQHEGLDWLANLYAKGRSGILADEMGLGKTIQSIALLAHLAEVHEVWGPHLIVVPTSVMLNWEMEFKKFLPGFKVLTYYGDQTERKEKRRGWLADDKFNVCITSYQLVLKDKDSFKRRRWHYMILDEAHNIKNFRSERWQTMMTFNTRARLLLTGTPLQNNLTELWSLLFFLHYGQEDQGEDDAFAGLKEWSEWFRRPVESILEHGRQVLDEEDREQVAKLHKVIRPFLLRRLKADVEKQMPGKYEHVEMCRLSKRQRQLYDGFMSRAQTKETLASGNYLSIINALMQLRKVCNHPDLFETRPINTSLAMPKAASADFEITDFLVRRRLMLDASNDLDLDFLQLAPVSNEGMSMIEVIETSKRHAYHQFKGLRESQSRRVLSSSGVFSGNAPSPLAWRGDNRIGVLGSLENVGRRARLQELDRTMYYEAYRHHQHPIYGRGLVQRVTINAKYERLCRLSSPRALSKWWEDEMPVQFFDMVHSVHSRSEQMQPFVEKYACVTPSVVATDLATRAVTEEGAQLIREASQSAWRSDRDNPDPFHLARMKLSIAFPDKRLLQYDCGKLQRLDKLLRQLQAGGHRALIFTQMTKVLDILEQFLNIHGHRYLRLDGATKIEQRQILTERFNNDNRILCFILSSRSGGLGINLTGADTVIFYDLDWNPAMDKQCTDRAHRIGQTRDVHIYRFVSEHTIESNILRKANQKQMLDDVVIQEGDFTTDYMARMSYRDMLDNGEGEGEQDEAGRAMDRVLGTTGDKNIVVLEQAEDQEDRAAAKVAAKEIQVTDDADFEDQATRATPQTGDARNTPTASTGGGLAGNGLSNGTDTAPSEVAEESEKWHHIDEYLIQLQRYLMKDIPLEGGTNFKKGKKGRRRDEHRVRRR